MRTLSDRGPASPLSSPRPAASSNLFSHRVIKNAAWRSSLNNDTWQPERKRSVCPFIHLWTPTVHLPVHLHTHTQKHTDTHTSSHSSSILLSWHFHPLLTLDKCACLFVCMCAPKVELFVQVCVYICLCRLRLFRLGLWTLKIHTHTHTFRSLWC